MSPIKFPSQHLTKFPSPKQVSDIHQTRVRQKPGGLALLFVLSVLHRYDSEQDSSKPHEKQKKTKREATVGTSIVGPVEHVAWAAKVASGTLVTKTVQSTRTTSSRRSSKFEDFAGLRIQMRFGHSSCWLTFSLDPHNMAHTPKYLRQTMSSLDFQKLELSYMANNPCLPKS